MLASAALLSLSTAGCGDRSFTYVGQVWDSDIVTAVTLEDGAMRAYVCGGPETYSTLSHWFEGRVEGDNSFSATTDDWSIHGWVGADWASGELEGPGGEYLSWEAYAPVDDLSGLYGVDDSGCRTGAVILDGGGGQPTLQGVWCDALGHRAQVTPVYPIELTDRGIHVQVDLGPLGLGGVRDLYVTRDSGH